MIILIRNTFDTHIIILLMADNQEKKKRSFRKEYLNDFKKDESGSYSYTGEYKTYCGSTQEWRRDIIILWVSCAVPAALLLVSGFLPGSGLSGNVLIILPYALELIALFILFWKMVRLTYGGMNLRKYVYTSTVGYLPGYTAAAAVCGGLALAGMIAALIIGTFTGTAAGLIIYLAGQLALLAGCFIILRTFRTMKWE